MSKFESQHELSEQGKTRKQAMLGQLQDELVSVHHKRRQRKTLAKGVAFALVVGVAGLVWAFVVRAPDSENRIAEATPNTSMLGKSIAAVGNVEGIDERCIVANENNSASIELMADDELLEMLAAIGRPSVLGEINGEIRIIPDTAPVRKRVEAL